MTNGTRRGWGVSVTPRPPFTSRKDPVPIVQEAGWAPGPVWTGAKNLAHTGIRSRTVQPVASRYTDWATGPTKKKVKWGNFQPSDLVPYIYIYIYIYIYVYRREIFEGNIVHVVEMLSSALWKFHWPLHVFRAHQSDLFLNNWASPFIS